MDALAFLILSLRGFNYLLLLLDIKVCLYAHLARQIRDLSLVRAIAIEFSVYIYFGVVMGRQLGA